MKKRPGQRPSIKSFALVSAILLFLTVGSPLRYAVTVISKNITLGSSIVTNYLHEKTLVLDPNKDRRKPPQADFHFSRLPIPQAMAVEEGIGQVFSIGDDSFKVFAGQVQGEKEAFSTVSFRPEEAVDEMLSQYMDIYQQMQLEGWNAFREKRESTVDDEEENRILQLIFSRAILLHQADAMEVNEQIARFYSFRKPPVDEDENDLQALQESLKNHHWPENSYVWRCYGVGPEEASVHGGCQFVPSDFEFMSDQYLEVDTAAAKKYPSRLLNLPLAYDFEGAIPQGCYELQEMKMPPLTHVQKEGENLVSVSKPLYSMKEIRPWLKQLETKPVGIYRYHLQEEAVEKDFLQDPQRKTLDVLVFLDPNGQKQVAGPYLFDNVAEATRFWKGVEEAYPQGYTLDEAPIFLPSHFVNRYREETPNQPKPQPRPSGDRIPLPPGNDLPAVLLPPKGPQNPKDKVPNTGASLFR